MRAKQAKAAVPLTVHGAQAAVARLLADADVLAELPADDVNTLVGNIASLLRLEQVPFAALVPHADMLPAESLRLFKIDTQWLQALMDGALSTGLRRSTDQAIYTELRDRIWNAALNHKADNTVELHTNGEKQSPAISGLLLRSELVATWPDLRIEAKDAQGQAIPVLRRENLGLNICMLLFEGVIHQICIAQPLVLLPPGVDDDDAIHCRAVGGSQAVGQPLDVPPVPLSAHWRDAPRRIVALGGDGGLVAAVEERLRSVGELKQDQRINPGAMALQWLASPQQLIL
jgi:hypothetical protein